MVASGLTTGEQAPGARDDIGVPILKIPLLKFKSFLKWPSTCPLVVVFGKIFYVIFKRTGALVLVATASSQREREKLVIPKRCKLRNVFSNLTDVTSRLLISYLNCM